MIITIITDVLLSHLLYTVVFICYYRLYYYCHYILHPIRIWSFRTQPLESLTPLRMQTNGFWATQPLAKILVREILLCGPGVRPVSL